MTKQYLNPSLGLCSFLGLLLIPFCLPAQGNKVYWNFAADSWNQAEGDIRLTGYNPTNDQFRLDGELPYLALPAEKPGQFFFPFTFEHSFSFEMLIRLSPQGQAERIRLFAFGGGAAFASFGGKSIIFRIKGKSVDGEEKIELLQVPLNGVGRRSVQYFLDQQWHHLVFRYDYRQKEISIWLDGQSPEGFSKELENPLQLCGQSSRQCQTQIRLLHGNTDPLVGDLAGIVVYDYAIPAGQIVQHYSDGVVQGKPYSFKVSRQVPIAENVPLTYDQRQYVPDSWNNKPAEAQLAYYMPPRYKAGHGLLPLYNWISLDYLSGRLYNKLNAVKAAGNAVALQRQMAANWHYYITIENAATIRNQSGKLDTSRIPGALIQLANEHPEWPLAVTTLWAQVRPEDAGYDKGGAFIRRLDLPSQYYLQTAKGDFLHLNGAIRNNPRWLRPTVPSKYAEWDGKTQQFYLQQILKYLDRPLNMINENGEVPPLAYTEKVLTLDPVVQADFAQSRLPDLKTYQATRKTSLRISYREELLALPALQDTRFSWYALDGNPSGSRFAWPQAREIHQPMNGQYYATPDFYPRWPANWNGIRGPWNGWPWIVESRKVEVKYGDRLFSPFVAAGWSKDPKENLRPGHWLGLLKHMGILGAEFMYPGFFTERANEIADPVNYVWQVAMPAYAQAITSHYEEVLREGNLIFNEENEPVVQWPVLNPQVLITARKHDRFPLYVIAANINPNSNYAGQVPDSLVVDCMIDNIPLKLPVRVQGSVFMVDLRNDSAVAWQLDGWHENQHPLRWNRAFVLEAEVFDSSLDIERRSNLPAGNQQLIDLSRLQTWIEPTGNEGWVEYELEVKAAQAGRYRLQLSGEALENGLSVTIDGELVLDNSSGGCIFGRKKKSANRMYENLFVDLVPGKQRLKVNLTKGVKLDAITLRPEDN